MAGRLWMRGAAAAVCAILLSSSAGCYDHVPVETPTSVVGQAVQLTLTAVGTEIMTGKIGPYVQSVDGRLIAAAADTITIAIASTTSISGISQTWQGEQIRFPTHGVSQMTVAELSKSKTIFAALASIAGIVALRSALGGTSFVGGGSSGGGIPAGK